MTNANRTPAHFYPAEAIYLRSVFGGRAIDAARRLPTRDQRSHARHAFHIPNLLSMRSFFGADRQTHGDSGEGECRAIRRMGVAEWVSRMDTQGTRLNPLLGMTEDSVSALLPSPKSL